MAAITNDTITVAAGVRTMRFGAGSPAFPALTISLAPSVPAGSAASGTITNIGGVSASWTLVASPSAAISPASGILAAGASVSFTVTPAAPGSYSVTLASAGASIGGSPAALTATTTADPAWRAAISVNSWGMAGANTLSSFQSYLDSITPVGADYVGRSMTLGLLAWSGGCRDEDGSEFWIPVAGGHGDYGGNEPYAINFSAATPTWRMVRPPSGTTPLGAIVAKDGQESTGVYSDGRIRAQHNYSNPVYLPGRGPAVARQVGIFYSPSGVHIHKTRLIDPNTGESTVLSDFSGFTGNGNADGAAAYDPSRNCIWTVGANTSTMVRINAATGAATKVGALDNWTNAAGGMVYVPTLDVLLIMPCPKFGAGAIGVFNCATGAATAMSTTGAWSSGFGFTPGNDGFGFDWASDLGCVVLWNNSGATVEISTLTPSGGATSPWAKGKLTVSGANVITPTAKEATGTFGRFFYSSKFGGCFLLNATTQDWYFFATR